MPQDEFLADNQMKKSDKLEPPRPVKQLLIGKTVVVTRVRTQSGDITSQLEAVGATVIHLPAIEVIPPASWALLDASIERITDYDFIIFTSANGVDFFFRRLREERSEGVKALAGRVICAIGPATARALEAAGVVAQVIASESRAEGVLKSIVDHLGREELVRGLSFLIPRAKRARDVLPDGLRALGARVDAVETYQTVRPNIQPDSIARLFTENSIDAITFTSSSTVSNFAALAGLADLSGLLADTLIACIGPVTAETAALHGLKNIIVSDEYNASALVNLIVKSIGRH